MATYAEVRAPPVVAGIALVALGRTAQNSAHRTLAALRDQRQHRDVRSRCADLEGSALTCAMQAYGLPTGGLFDYVCCPHYTAEVTIYTGLSVVQGFTWTSAWLIAWVLVNLAVTARANRAWYLAHFASFPRSRAAIIPFLF